jgi:predicted transposase/invertase (TIGR01784 family)
MDFSFTHSPHQNVKTEVVLYDLENKIVFSDKLKFIYLEMNKFDKNIDELENYYEKWLYLLKNLAFLDEIPTKLREKAFQKVFKIAEIAKYNPKERQNYENSLKYYRDMENSLDLKYAKGLKEGKEEGLKEGKEEGLKEGLLNTARNMKARGFSITDIIDLIGLTETEIKEL